MYHFRIQQDLQVKSLATSAYKSRQEQRWHLLAQVEVNPILLHMVNVESAYFVLCKYFSVLI